MISTEKSFEKTNAKKLGGNMKYKNFGRRVQYF